MSVVLTTGKISALTAITKILPDHAERYARRFRG